MKRHEARNISLVANVSRDVLCKRFTAQREVQANALEAAALRLTKLQRSSWHAIAWEKHNAAPEGVRCTRAAPIHARMPATGGPPMPATCGPPKPATGGHPMPATDGHLVTAATSPSSSSVSTSSVLKRRSSTMTSSEQTYPSCIEGEPGHRQSPLRASHKRQLRASRKRQLRASHRRQLSPGHRRQRRCPPDQGPVQSGTEQAHRRCKGAVGTAESTYLEHSMYTPSVGRVGRSQHTGPPKPNAKTCCAP